MTRFDSSGAAHPQALPALVMRTGPYGGIRVLVDGANVSMCLVPLYSIDSLVPDFVQVRNPS